MPKTSLPPSALARQYFGGLAHVHTILSNHPHHNESNLHITRLIELLLEEFKLEEPPLGYILINEHSSDPDKPRPLGRLSLRGRRLLRERRRGTILGVPILYGLEVSMLPNGKTDLTPRLADNCALVIASRHRLPNDIERDPKHIMALFHDMCGNPAIDVIGHPLRYIDQVPGIDWQSIFELARQTNTALEINFNNFPGTDDTAERKTVWKQWLKMLALSKAPVFIGTDIHSDGQLSKFAQLWRQIDKSKENKLASFVMALDSAGIGPERVITSTPERLRAWISIDKPQRSQLS